LNRSGGGAEREPLQATGVGCKPAACVLQKFKGLLIAEEELTNAQSWASAQRVSGIVYVCTGS
jgi:hypothetical protein